LRDQFEIAAVNNLGKLRLEGTANAQSIKCGACFQTLSQRFIKDKNFVCCETKQSFNSFGPVKSREVVLK